MTKPGGTFFDEPSPRYNDLYRALKSLSKDDTLIIVGTSLMVTNPISIIRRMEKLGIPRIIFVDKKMPYEVILPGIEGWEGASAEVLPKLLALL
jgi:NAD-dependent SIR2 family protein deacetylase